MKIGAASWCWPGLVHALPGEEQGPLKRTLRPPTREEYSAPDVVIGLAVGLGIGEEGA